MKILDTLASNIFRLNKRYFVLNKTKNTLINHEMIGNNFSDNCYINLTTWIVNFTTKLFMPCI